MANGLTEKQQLFVDEYLKCFNATEAARRAKYQGNDITLASVGYENLRKPQIKEHIDQRLQESAMSADEALMRLAKQARGDMGAFAYLRSPDDLANHPQSEIIKKLKVKRRIIESEEGEQVITEEIEDIELYDAHAPLVDILKVLGKFTDKQEIKIEDATLTDEERIRRIAAILDRGRERGDRSPDSGD